MGFSAPSPDPQLVAEQKREAAQAKLDRISLISQQLNTEDQLRSAIYGVRTPLIPGIAPGGTGTGGTAGGGGRFGNKSPSGQFFMNVIQSAVR